MTDIKYYRYRKNILLQSFVFCKKRCNFITGFAEDIFVHNSNVNSRYYYGFLEEMSVLIKGIILLNINFPEEFLLRICIGFGNKRILRALGYLFTEHQIHHFNIINQ